MLGGQRNDIDVVFSSDVQDLFRRAALTNHFNHLAVSSYVGGNRITELFAIHLGGQVGFLHMHHNQMGAGGGCQCRGKRNRSG